MVVNVKKVSTPQIGSHFGEKSTFFLFQPAIDIFNLNKIREIFMRYRESFPSISLQYLIEFFITCSDKRNRFAN